MPQATPARAGVISSLRWIGLALPRIVILALPFVILAVGCGLISSASGIGEAGWRWGRLGLSVASAAILVTVARSALDSASLPRFVRIDKALGIFLLGWLPLAGALYLATLPGIWFALFITAVMLGWVVALLLGIALGETADPWSLRAILRSSMGALVCFLLPPAIMLILSIPLIGLLGATNPQILEADLPTQGGALTALGLASETLAAFVPLLAAAAVGHYLGSLLREWRGQH